MTVPLKHELLGRWTPHPDFAWLCSPWTVTGVIEDAMLPYHGAYYQWDSGMRYDCSVPFLREWIKHVRAVRS